MKTKLIVLLLFSYYAMVGQEYKVVDNFTYNNTTYVVSVKNDADFTAFSTFIFKTTSLLFFKNNWDLERFCKL